MLIEIDDQMFQAKVKETEGTLRAAELEYNRQLALAKAKAGKGANLDKAMGEFQVAQGRAQAAKIELENSKITAPFDGYVGLRNVSVGALVNEQTDLLTLVDLDPIKIDFRLPATHIQKN